MITYGFGIRPRFRCALAFNEWREAHLGATMAILIGAGIAAAGSATSAVIGAHAAHSAADQMSAGANEAKALALKSATTANAGIDQGVKTAGDLNQTNQQMLSPYINAGEGTLGTLSTALKSGGSLNTPFDASMMEKNDPGYAFRLQQGQQAVERSAAARGLTMSGGTLKDLTSYEQGLASSEYGNAFARYTQQQQQLYNQLMGVTTLGANATNTGINSNNNFSGMQLNAKEMQGSNTMTAAQIAGNAAVGAANAQAAGTVGAANAWGKGIVGATNAVSEGLTLASQAKVPAPAAPYSMNDLTSLPNVTNNNGTLAALSPTSYASSPWAASAAPLQDQQNASTYALPGALPWHG